MARPQTGYRPGGPAYGQSAGLSAGEEHQAVREALRKEAITAVGHQLDVARREADQRRTMDMVLVATLISATVATGFGLLRVPRPFRGSR